MSVTGKNACELSAAGLGLMVGAIGSGVTGGTMTFPAMVLGGAAGYIFGKAVCKIPALQKAFDRAIGLDDWTAVETAFADPSIRKQGVELVVAEVGVSHARAEQIWDAVSLATLAHPKQVAQSASFKAAAHHPSTGGTRHGIELLRLTSPAGA